MKKQHIILLALIAPAMLFVLGLTWCSGSNRQRLVDTDSRPQTLSLQPSSPTAQHLREPLSTQIEQSTWWRVVGRLDGAAVPNCAVISYGNGRPQRILTHTDANGRMRSPREDPGTVLIFDAHGYELNAVTVSDVQRTELVILDRAKQLRGVVRNVPYTLTANYRLRVTIVYPNVAGNVLLQAFHVGDRHSVIAASEQVFALDYAIRGRAKAELCAIHKYDHNNWSKLRTVELEDGQEWVDFDLGAIGTPAERAKLLVTVRFAGDYPSGRFALRIDSLDMNRSVRQHVNALRISESSLLIEIPSVPYGLYVPTLDFEAHVGLWRFAPVTVEGDSTITISVPRGAEIAVDCLAVAHADLMHNPVALHVINMNGEFVRVLYLEGEQRKLVLRGVPTGKFLLHLRGESQMLRSKTIVIETHEAESLSYSLQADAAVNISVDVDIPYEKGALLEVLDSDGICVELRSLRKGQVKVPFFLRIDSYQVIIRDKITQTVRAAGILDGNRDANRVVALKVR